MNLNCCQIRQFKGFTLIELLVVVFLIGLISGFAVLSISSRGDDREIGEELKRLQYRLNLAIEESVIKGKPIGIRFEEEQYQFLEPKLAKWSELEGNRALSTQNILFGWRFELRLSSKKIPLLEVDDDDDKGSEKLTPQIVFYSSGEVDPFELVVIDTDNRPVYRLWYAVDGVIALESMEPE